MVLKDAIGNTPTVRLRNVERWLGGEAQIFAKLEMMNPGGSIKDRAALAMLQKEIKDGRLRKGGKIVSATSGNFGISLAMLSTTHGYNTTVVMPESASEERRSLVKAYGARLIVPNQGGMSEAVSVAKEIADKEGAIYLDQFVNPESIRCHYNGTGRELWVDMQSKLDIFLSGVGTGGTLCGVASFLKEQKNTIMIYAVEPSESPTLSGGKPSSHGIEGIGADFIPPLYSPEIVDSVVRVSTDEAKDAARTLARLEGIFAGISSGASLAAIKRLVTDGIILKERVAFVIADGGERYFSRGIID